MPVKSAPTNYIDLPIPAAVEVERLVLGVIETDPEAASHCLEILEVDDFSVQKHRLIFAAAKHLADAGEQIDRVTLARALIARGQLEAVDGIGYLTELDTDLPRIYGLENYLRTLRHKSVLRKAANAATQLLHEVCLPGADIDAVARAEEFLRTLTDRDQKRSLMGLEEHLESTGTSLDAFLRPDHGKSLVPTPWTTLNEILGGFRPAQLIVLAARPGMGKSAAASQIAVAAARAGYGTAVFSFEMAAQEIWRRLVAHISRVSLRRITRGDYSSLDQFHVQGAASELAQMNVWIDETTGCTVAALSAALRKHRSKGHEVGLVVIDYLQLMQTTRRREKRVEEVTEISRLLKVAARELKVPILVLSQLNREVEKDGARPELHHLRESGSIEQDADAVLFLWQDRRERQKAIQEKRPGEMEIIVRKQRNGSVGFCKVMFEPRIMTLSETLERV